MKIILYCYAFFPSIGGIETIAETLAINFKKLGHECTVVTESLNTEKDDFTFEIVRRPTNSAYLS